MKTETANHRRFRPRADGSVNRAAERAEHDLPRDDGADAKLFHVIVAAHPAHQFEKLVGGNEDREPIAHDHERGRDAKHPREQKHDEGHDHAGECARQQPDRRGPAARERGWSSLLDPRMFIGDGKRHAGSYSARALSAGEVERRLRKSLSESCRHMRR